MNIFNRVNRRTSLLTRLANNNQLPEPPSDITILSPVLNHLIPD